MHTEALARDIRTFLSVMVILVIVRAIFGYGTDATDLSSDQRSGLSLYTDYGTGCQYVGTIGALTPRLIGNGKQAGCKTP